MNPTDMRPFIQTGVSFTIAATVTSGNNAITGVRPKNPEIPATFRVYNAGPDVCYIGQGATAPTVTATNGIPVPPGNTEIFQMAGDTAFVGALSVGTSLVYFTPGQGA